jgi:hypothetical protein
MNVANPRMGNPRLKVVVLCFGILGPAFASTGEVRAQGGAAGSPSVTTSSLGPGFVGQTYSAGLTASGGSPPYSWSIASGSLPAGLTLSTAGSITGTPTAVGTSNFTVKVTDSASQTGTKLLSITISLAPLVITTASPLPIGAVSAPYSQALAATGGTTPYTWSVVSGTLPAGLTLSGGGVISGTPTAQGTASFTVQVTDSGMRTATKLLSITVTPPVSVITTTSPLPSGTVGAFYSQTLAATNVIPPYTWSLASGTLPAGLTLSAAGVISGIPTVVGVASFTVRVTDSTSQIATKALSITISLPALLITTEFLPIGTVGSPYFQNLAASGGTPPYTWSLLSGALPAGLAISSAGLISGTPTEVTSSSLTIKVSDSASQTASKILSLTINATPISITTASPLPTAIVGSVYSATLGASGGVPPYSWSIVGSTLPAGLTLSSGGILSGTPANPGNFSLTIQVSDTTSAAASKVFSLTVQVALTITTTSPLPTAVVGSPYSQQLQASLTDPLAWSVVSGNLPSGITLSSSGLISGTPTAAGTYDFTVQATGGTPQQVATKPFRLEVSAGFVIITPPTLPDGTALLPYTMTLTANGGTTPYTWILSGGNLPNGLNLSTSGVISGTATTTGVFTIKVQASDAADRKASKDFTLSIVAPPLGKFSLNAPATMNPAEQVPVGLSLSAAQPNPVTGSLKILFASNSAVPADDPAVLFSNSSRTVSFTIAANSTTAVFPAPVLLMTGTVTGTVVATVDVDSGSTGMSAGTVTILPTPPKLVNIAAERTPGGLRVQVTGYSPERKLSNAQFGFDVRTPAGIQHVNLVRNVESDFATWYNSPASAAYGSSFMFEQLFTVQGDASMIDSVTVSLTNAQGTASSTPVTIVPN